MKKYLIAWAVCCILPLTARAADITVAAAANVQFTLDELSAEFTKETGIAIKPVIGASGKLTAQIENSAPFDVFMSADMKYPQRLYKEGQSAQAPKVYVYGHLVLWTMKDIDLSKGVDGLSDSSIHKIAIASPAVAPYGRESVNAMKASHLYPGIAAKLVYGESIAQANQFIMTGAADIGFTAESVVMAPNMKGKGKYVEVNSDAYKPIAQGVIVLKYSQKAHTEEAEKFYQFLFSSVAQEIFKKYGYTLP